MRNVRRQRDYCSLPLDISPELTEPKTRANLEPLNEQILTITQLFYQPIRYILAKNSPAESSGTQRLQTWCIKRRH